MGLRRLLVAGALVGVVAFARGPRASGDATDKDDLIDGTLARAEAVVSGRFAYEVECHPADSPPDDEVESYTEFVFSGTSWRMDYPRIGLGRVNHRGKLIELSRHKSSDKNVHVTTLGRARSPMEQEPYPPSFAGSLWNRGTVDYIRSHKGEAAIVGAADVDGISCAIIEWKIPAADAYAAFVSIPPALSKGGALRLYISAELGYVAPRIDHLTPDGDLAERFDASNFKDVGSGIQFPMNLKSQTFPGETRPGFIIEYKIESVTDINAPIPDSAFAAELPAGAKTREKR